MLVAHFGEGGVLGSDVGVDLLVVEAGGGGLDVVLLAHFEVLAEVLVAAPPVRVDHAQALVAALLVQVRVLEVVLLAIVGEAAVLVRGAVLVVGLADAVAPVLAHALLLVIDEGPEHERAVQVEQAREVQEAHAVSLHEGRALPVYVPDWVLEETSNVLETSPLLCHVLWLLLVLNELSPVTVSLLSEGSMSMLRSITSLLTLRPYRHAR